jgi:division protein CdvB (Snf7/Vps24/ESCRT-III family)
MSNDIMKAFPYTGAGTDGMDLRDYFAAKAMQGMLAGYQGNPPEPEKVVEDAYYYADQMLKARENHE